MRIAIVDDLKSDRDITRIYLEQYLNSSNIGFEVEEFISGEVFLESIEKNEVEDFDLIFLDIYMDKINGMEVAKKLEEMNLNSMIFFTTSSIEYAVESYEVKAAYYLIKPYTYEKFKKAMDRYKDMFLSESKFIEVLCNRVIKRIFLKDIVLIQTANRLVEIYTKKDKFTTRQGFDELATVLLENKNFVCCVRGCVVNFDYIIKVNDDSFMTNEGLIAPIRRQGRSDIKKKYTEYLFKSMREGL
ncbi:two component transcriptional regulator, LytTR family [Clostridium collagenovorans DSM 3089]|uniref:Stage 0 sporulation protein A homolog n=1 Tax=Clostridium collagenovorans DSM 3089 TaxID=1121306 RepID=A0A1M5Y7F0_9CLOT|nr:LytTR family DNA-binding domain-containing protein [Clostridium collagenovorans]SHI07987.1 two component transcriptional regulator, LytTR family [Clostridium collagenovorans DSM 3089]